MNWQYDEASDAWLYGTPQEGCGVFANDEKRGPRWEGNAVFRNNIVHFGPYNTKKKAQRTTLTWLQNQIKNQ